MGLAPALGAGRPAQAALHEGKQNGLKNVRLETGFIYEGEEVIATRTGLYGAEMIAGNIAAILPVDVMPPDGCPGLADAAGIPGSAYSPG